MNAVLLRALPYNDPERLLVTVDSESFSVRVPAYLPKMEARRAMRQGDLLFVIGVTDTLYHERFTGFLIVAHLESDGEFSAVVWHETYPYAIERLGLDAPPSAI